MCSSDVLNFANRINFVLGKAILCVAEKHRNEKKNLTEAIACLLWFKENILAIEYCSSPMAPVGKQKSEALKYLERIQTMREDEFLSKFLECLFCHATQGGIRENTIDSSIKMLERRIKEFH